MFNFSSGKNAIHSEKVVTDYLTQLPNLGTFYISIHHKRFAQDLIKFIDFDSGCLDRRFGLYICEYDDFVEPAYKVIASDLLENGAREQINVQLKAKHPKLGKLSKTKCSELISTQLRQVVQAVPLATAWERVWQELADLIAENLFSDIKTSQPISRHIRLNKLLLIGFFSKYTGRGTLEAYGEFLRAERTAGGVRGWLTRLPGAISSQGIPRDEYGIAIDAIEYPEPRTRFSLKHSTALPLAKLVSDEIGKSKYGTGFLNRVLNVPKFVEAQKQIEFLVLTVLAVGLCERLIKNAYELSAGGSISRNDKVIELSSYLGLPQQSNSAVEKLFSHTHANLRNRIAHGSLLELSTDWRHRVLQSHESDPVNRDCPANSPEHILNCCFEYLLEIDSGIHSLRNQQGCPENWIADFEFNRRLPKLQQFNDCAPEWLNDLGKEQVGAIGVIQSINFVSPSVKYLIQSAGLSQVNSFFSAACLGVAFETVLRNTLSLIGQEIVSPQSIQRSGLGTESLLSFYIEANEEGLMSSDCLQSLVRFASNEDRKHLTETIKLSIAWRDTLVHGAIDNRLLNDVTEATKVVWSGIAILTRAAVHHMTEEAAFLRHTRPVFRNESALQNWLMAEKEISEQIAQAIAWDSERNVHLQKLKSARDAGNFL